MGGASGRGGGWVSALGGLGPVTFSATATACTPAQLTIVSGNNQTGVAGTALANPLVVKLTDSHGNAVAGQTITFTAAANNGTLSSTTAVTAADGQAQVS